MLFRGLRSTTALCFALALVAPAGGSQLIPRTLAELAAGSDCIFVGRCESISTHWNQEHTLILTANRFRVLRAIKGAPAATLTVDELGGTVGDTTLQVSEVPRYSVGQEALVCVHRTPLGRWETFGAGQGRFQIIRDPRGRVWARSDFYQAQLAGMKPGGRADLGAPLASLAGQLQAATPAHGARP